MHLEHLLEGAEARREGPRRRRRASSMTAFRSRRPSVTMSSVTLRLPTPRSSSALGITPVTCAAVREHRARAARPSAHAAAAVDEPPAAPRELLAQLAAAAKYFAVDRVAGAAEDGDRGDHVAPSRVAAGPPASRRRGLGAARVGQRDGGVASHTGGAWAGAAACRRSGGGTRRRPSRATASAPGIRAPGTNAASPRQRAPRRFHGQTLLAEVAAELPARPSRGGPHRSSRGARWSGTRCSAARRARRAPTKAPVGQASRQARHDPQRSGSGSSWLELGRRSGSRR